MKTEHVQKNGYFYRSVNKEKERHAKKKHKIKSPLYFIF